jgi:hypothetical protein
MKKWLLRRKLKKLNMDWIEISEYALLDYRHQVKGNRDENTWTLERKLNRNWYMAVQVYENEKDNIIHKKFGALTIIYDKSKNMIVGITNHRHGWNGCEIDSNLKQELNKLYGLN